MGCCGSDDNPNSFLSIEPLFPKERKCKRPTGRNNQVEEIINLKRFVYDDEKDEVKKDEEILGFFKE